LHEEQLNDLASIWHRTYEIWTTALSGAYSDLISAAAAFIPNLVGALILLVFGWALAIIVRMGVLRLGTGLDRVFQSARIRTEAHLPTRWPASRIVAYTAYWLIILFFISVSASVLELPSIADAFRQLLVYLPVLLLLSLGFFVVYALTGLLAERVIRAAEARGLDNARLLGALVRSLILTCVVIIAIGAFGLDVTLLVNVISLVVGALLGGAALAFGLGAGGVIGNVIAAHSVRGLYSVGQRVRIENIEGEVLEVTASAVVIDSAEGRTVVPARRFLDAASVLLEREAS
jgi:small-conductance mechanosensitive channel